MLGMASKYLNWKFRDIKPDEPSPPLSGKKRLANWFHYHTWWLVVWAALLYIVGSTLWNALGIGQTGPDYIFAYIGSNELPEGCAASLEAELAALGEDVNGDGRVVVEFRQYATNRSGDMETAMYYNYAADVVLLADITNAESYFFLAEDAYSVQRAYQIFAQADGTPPEDGDDSVEGKVFRWGDCPVLSALAVDQETLKGLYLGRRCFYDASLAEGRETDAVLWEVITEGANPS